MSAAAQKLFGRLGQVGVLAAVVGGVAQSALYNGMSPQFYLSTSLLPFQLMVDNALLSSIAFLE